MSYQILILHGPNLNLLGSREPKHYGTASLEDLNQQIQRLGNQLDTQVHARQSNLEGELITWLQTASAEFDGIVFNPGGYSHTSVAIRDAVAAISIPVVEVHLSHVDSREDFRKQAIIAPVCIGRVSGFGTTSYLLGLRAVLDYLSRVTPTEEPG